VELTISGSPQGTGLEKAGGIFQIQPAIIMPLLPGFRELGLNFAKAFEI